MTLRRPAAAAALVALAVGCGGGGQARPRTDVPEPARSPAATVAPAGRVVPLPGAPEGVTVDPGTGRVAVGVRSPTGVVILDPDGRQVGLVPLAGAPRHLESEPATGLVLAPLEGADQLAVVDPARGVLRATVAVGRQPHDVAAAAGRRFVGDEAGDALSVVAGDRTVATLPVPVQPGGVAANGRSVAVVGVRGGRIEAIDPASLRSLGTAACGVGPTHVAAGPDGRYYVADTQGDRVVVFDDRPTLRQMGSAPARGAPYGLAVDAARRRLWVTLTASNTLVEYDLAGRLPRPVARYPTVRQPDSVAVEPSTGVVVVTGTADGQLQLVDPGR